MSEWFLWGLMTVALFVALDRLLLWMESERWINCGHAQSGERLRLLARGSADGRPAFHHVKAFHQGSAGRARKCDSNIGRRLLNSP